MIENLESKLPYIIAFAILLQWVSVLVFAWFNPDKFPENVAFCFYLIDMVLLLFGLVGCSILLSAT
jgi:hypothetical protein